MSIPGDASPLLLGGGAQQYKIERSLRFNSSDSAFCSRVFTSAGNRKTWTWSAWFKRGKLGTSQCLFGRTGNTDATCLYIVLDGDNKIRVSGFNPGAFYLISSSVYRDTSAWYHITVAINTTESSAANRAKIWINGTQLTAFDTDNRSAITQNSDLPVNEAVLHEIGNLAVASFYGDFYLADIHFIDGQALDPTSFAETNITTGQWVPKAYTGTYGTNGFRLAFADNSNNTATTLGKDSSPNGHNWTPNNLSVLSGGPTSVVAASGALPIYNTTDTYGNVKGSGTRTDSNSSSIVLAVPMDGANNGTTFTDESATIKGSGSSKAITVFGDTKTITAQSKFYGSSAYFDGTGDYLSVAASSDYVFGTGDYTVEGWIYSASTTWTLYATGGSGSNDQFVCDGGVLYWDYNTTIGVSNYFTSNDLNKWVHVCVSRSGTTLRIFKNGVIFATYTSSTSIGTNTTAFIGVRKDASYYTNGYIQDVRVYKGVAKYTSNFNPPSATQNSTIAAGNDSLVDTPTSYGTDTGAGGEVRGNYCTLNPLAGGSSALSNGNLQVTSTAGFQHRYGSIGVSSGKWYWEHVFTVSPTASVVGISNDIFETGSTFNGIRAYLSTTGNKYAGTSFSSYGATWAINDVMGIALDMDAGTLTFYKNGVSQGTAFTGLTGTWFPLHRDDGNATAFLNFGQRPFAYTAPSGFKALCDTNLPAPVVAKPNSVFDVKLYTGNGSTQTISGLGFSPDLVWIKSRSSSVWWNLLFDQIRGAGKWLSSNATDAEAGNGSQLLTAFTSGGFSLNLDPNGTVNANGDTYVAWAWDAGSSTVTNTQGSITSQVRANASAGFSIVTYVGAQNGTVGHGLGIAPGLIIAKSRTYSDQPWVIYHLTIGKDGGLRFDTTTGFSISNYWGASVPGSTTFGTANVTNPANGYGNMVAYCWAPVAGYSSFGSYNGNGSADGPFVYTGHRSRWVLIKDTSTGTGGRDWFIVDTARNTFNVTNSLLRANLSNSESSYDLLDITCNGFKLRGNDAAVNNSGSTYIYAAFAENPFQYARAR